MAVSSTACSYVKVLFAPLPDAPVRDGESAALEFAQRASEMLQKGAILDKSKISIEIAPLTNDINAITALAEDKDLIIFVVSCGADGSIHRDVRKLTRQLNSSREIQLSQSARLVVALLGHAICHNSANQMESEIFRAGRKLAKGLGAEKGGGMLLETQVELESPEATFDPFIQRHGSEILLTKK
jgi:hypothetical protein